MKHSILIVGVLLTLVAGLPAKAQIERPEKPWGLKVGGLFPIKSDLRDTTSDIWFIAGIDYHYTTSAYGGDWVATFEFATESDARIWSLQALHQWRRASGFNNTFYYGLGGGVYFVNNTEDETEFGVPIVLGYEFNNRWFIEGKFNWTVSDPDFNTSHIAVGVRF